MPIVAKPKRKAQAKKAALNAAIEPTDVDVPYKRPVPEVLIKNQWKPGQSGNPGGRNGEYGKMMSLCRQYSAQAAQNLIDIATSSEDERNRVVASNAILDRAWGKPKEQDPNERPNLRPDLSKLSNADLAKVRAAATILMKAAVVGAEE